MTQTSAKMK
uniref:Uncharacterized protein n=1 Tax=Rhizophora mucronata TaxID=61149 RepID=A0A2P2PAU8_RHIMU